MSRWWVFVVGCAVAGCSGQEPTDPKEQPSDPTSNPETDEGDDDDDDEVGDDDDEPAGPALETVRVLTYPDELPLVGARVLISDADGGIVDLLTTDEGGEIAVDVPERGSVTFAEETPWGSELTTIFDVPEGGAAHFWSYRFYAPDSWTNDGVVYDITASATQSPAEVAMWRFLTLCDGLGANAPGPWVLDNADCTGRPTDQVMVLGFDSDQQLVAWGAQLDLPLTGDLDVAVPLTETSLQEVEASMTGLPSDTGRVYMSVTPSHEGWRTYEPSWYKDQGVGETEAVTLSFPDLPYERYSLWAYADVGGLASVGRRVVSSTLPSTLSVDVAPLALISVDSLDLSDPEHPAISWLSTAGDRGDYGLAWLSWSNTSDSHSWSATFEPSRSRVQMPTLPEEFADFVFAPERVDPAGVGFYDYDLAQGYADAIDGSLLPLEEYEQTWSSASSGEGPLFF